VGEKLRNLDGQQFRAESSLERRSWSKRA
jgi:hypothetical protein